MHREIVASEGRFEVDHRDGDGLNNQRHNLRIATSSQNQGNQCKTQGRTSRFKGVSWAKRHGKWVAQIQVKRRSKNLGYFRREEEAAAAYDQAALRFFGEFARLNA